MSWLLSAFRQQSWAASQQKIPQQNCVSLHIGALGRQIGAAQEPKLQNGWDPPHVVPHAPQLKISFSLLTHLPLQHWSPSKHPFGQGVPPAPPLPADELLADELPLLLTPVVALPPEPLAAAETCPVMPGAPPLPATLTSPPQEIPPQAMLAAMTPMAACMTCPQTSGYGMTCSP
jgi:hypothetical protein